jgi:hypothetical protein
MWMCSWEFRYSCLLLISAFFCFLLSPFTAQARSMPSACCTCVICKRDRASSCRAVACISWIKSIMYPGFSIWHFPCAILPVLLRTYTDCWCCMDRILREAAYFRAIFSWFGQSFKVFCFHSNLLWKQPWVGNIADTLRNSLVCVHKNPTLASKSCPQVIDIKYPSTCQWVLYFTAKVLCS